MKRRFVTAPGAAEGVTDMRCCGCGRMVAREGFNPMTSMASGLCPWCIECIAGLGDAGEVERKRYKRDYMREYMRAVRLRTGGIERATVSVAGRGRLTLRWSPTTLTIRVTGRWGMLEDGLRCLTGPFGVAVGNVRERGRGGGSGSRRHKTFISTGPVDEEAWRRGLEALRAEGAL